MAVLITGANGFVGKALFKRLSLEMDVIGLSRKNDIKVPNIFILDLLNEKATETFFKNYSGTKINTIVHLASITANKNNVNDLSVLYNNATMAKNIAIAAKVYGIENLVHLSSSSVYPNVDGDYDEASIVKPHENTDAIYGLSKFNEEVLLDHYCGGTTNVIHLRASMIYGPGMNDSRIIPVLEKEIIEKGTVTLFGNGTRLINLIHIDALVKLIVHLIKNPQKGIINVAEECIQLIDLAKRLINSYENKKIKIILNPSGNSQQFRLITKKYEALKKKGDV